MGGRRDPSGLARALLAAALGLVVVLAWAGPTPVQAARQTTLIISSYISDTRGDGNGTVTSDVGPINCVFTAGVQSGTCFHTYIYLDAYPLDVELTYTPATGSYVCLVQEIVCYTDGSVRTQVVRLDGQATTTLYPSFTRRTFTVQVRFQGPGSVTSSAGGWCAPGTNYDLCRAVKYGTSLVLTAVPDSGYHFSYWGGACAANQGTTCPLTITGNVTASASFDYWEVRVYRDDGGDVCVTNTDFLCTEGFTGAWMGKYIPGGTTLNVEARPKPGRRFDEWAPGPCAGQPATCSFVVSGAASLVARFALISTPTPAPTSTAKPAASGTPKPSATPAATPTAPALPTATAAPIDATPTEATASATPPSSSEPGASDPASGVPSPADGATAAPGDGATPLPASGPAVTPGPSPAPVAGPAEGADMLLFPAVAAMTLVVAFGAFLAGRRSRRAGPS